MNVLYFFTLASGASIFDCFGQKTTLKQLNRCLPAQPIGRFKSKTFSLGLTRFQCKRDENFQPKKSWHPKVNFTKVRPQWNKCFSFMSTCNHRFFLSTRQVWKSLLKSNRMVVTVIWTTQTFHQATRLIQLMLLVKNGNRFFSDFIQIVTNVLKCKKCVSIDNENCSPASTAYELGFNHDQNRLTCLPNGRCAFTSLGHNVRVVLCACHVLT